MIEKDIESRFKTRIESLKNGVLCLKLTCPGFTGVPDRLILLPGAHIIFVELKKPGKAERKRQLYVQGLLRKLGFEVYSAVNTYEQIEFIRERCRRLLEYEGFCTT